MNQHPVPQQISSYQFRLVGDMTLKQFFQLAIGILFAVLVYSTNWYTIIKVPLIIFSIATGAAFAFLPYKERPLSIWIFAFFRSIYAPTEYSWGKTKDGYKFFTADAETTDELSPNEVKIAAKDEKKSAPLAKLEQSEKQFLKKMNLLLRGDEEAYQKLTQTGSEAAQRESAEDVLNKLQGGVTMQAASTAQPQTTTAQPQTNTSFQPSQPLSSQPAAEKTQINDIIKPAPRHSFQVYTEESNQPSQTTQPQQPRATPNTQQISPGTSQQPLATQQQPVPTAPIAQQASAPPAQSTQPTQQQQQPFQVGVQVQNPAYPNAQTVYNQQIAQQQSTQNNPQPIQNPSATPQQDQINPYTAFSRNAPPPMPPDRAGNLTGQVMDPQGEALEGAILEVTDESGSPLRAVKTNKNGHFSVVTPLHNGVYTLVTEKDGFSFEPMKFEVLGDIVPPFAIRASINQS